MKQRRPAGEVGALVAQTTVSWVVQMVVIFVLAAGSDQDWDGGFLAVFIGPVLFNCVALGVGLPLRLSDSRWNFLRRHGEIPLVVALLGVILTLVGNTTGLGWMVIGGFVLIPLGLTNAFPPLGWLWDNSHP